MDDHGLHPLSEDDWNGTSRFEENSERRVLRIRNRALKHQQAADCLSKPGCDPELLFQNEIRILKKEWPVLFGGTLERFYVFMDLDCFFISAETLDRPELGEIPSAVTNKGIVAAANYKARAYGVRSGVPLALAKQSCPNLTTVNANHEKYKRCSEAVMALLREYDVDLEIYGLDEACLSFDAKKLAAACRRYGIARKGTSGWPPNPSLGFGARQVERLVEGIRKHIKVETGLGISAGISVCRGLAKYASNLNKPDGQFKIDSDFDSHMLHLNVDKLNGIGKATKEILRSAFKIETVADLREKLVKCAGGFPYKTFVYLLRLAHGLSSHDMTKHKHKHPLSCGMSLTISLTSSTSDILFYLWKLSETLEGRLGAIGMEGSCVMLTVRYSNFHTFTKRKSYCGILSDRQVLFESVVSLMDQIFEKNQQNQWLFNLPIRLLAISVGALQPVKSCTRLEKYSSESLKFDSRKCVVCGKQFVHESQRVFQAHVNSCADRRETVAKKPQSPLFKLFEKAAHDSCSG